MSRINTPVDPPAGEPPAAITRPLLCGATRLVRWGVQHRFEVGAVAILTALYSILSIRRHLTFHSGGYDLGIFEQAIRAYSGLQSPIVVLKGADFNLLGDHFHPILMLLGPVYAAWPSLVTLLVSQAFLFALAVAPLIGWARSTLGTPLALIIGVVYGLSFGIASAIGYDFHEIAFAVPLIAFALSALGQRRSLVAALWSLPLVLIKEDLGLSVVAAVGLIILFRGERRLGAALAIFGAAASMIEVFVVLPGVNSGGSYAYWARVSHSAPLFDVALAALGMKLATLAATFGISGGAALLSPMALIALPTLAWRFFSADANYWGTGYHYSAVLMPIVVAAMIDGLVRLRLRTRPQPYRPARARTAHRLCVAFVGASLIVTGAVLPTHALGALWSKWLWTTTAHTRVIQSALDRIPDGATVSASDDLVPHLTARDTVTLFGLSPLTAVDPQWIVVDELSTRHFRVTQAAEQKKLVSAVQSGYRVVFAHDRVTLLAR